MTRLHTSSHYCFKLLHTIWLGVVDPHLDFLAIDNGLGVVGVRINNGDRDVFRSGLDALSAFDEEGDVT